MQCIILHDVYMMQVDPPLKGGGGPLHDRFESLRGDSVKSEELAGLIEQHFQPGEWFTSAEFRERVGVQLDTVAVGTLYATHKQYGRRALARHDPRRIVGTAPQRYEYAR